jgi:hypothetical protein
MPEIALHLPGNTYFPAFIMNPGVWFGRRINQFAPPFPAPDTPAQPTGALQERADPVVKFPFGPFFFIEEGFTLEIPVKFLVKLDSDVFY